VNIILAKSSLLEVYLLRKHLHQHADGSSSEDAKHISSFQYKQVINTFICVCVCVCDVMCLFLLYVI